jgi:hypothetical protein
MYVLAPQGDLYTRDRRLMRAADTEVAMQMPKAEVYGSPIVLRKKVTNAIRLQFSLGILNLSVRTSDLYLNNVHVN